MDKLGHLTSILCILFFPALTYGFAEDVCLNSSHKWENCMSAAYCDQYSIDSTSCRANIVWDAATTQIKSGARSVVHSDSTYLIAQAVGIRADVAYWLAAYDQATDSTQFEPYDSYGNLYDPKKNHSYATVSLLGFARLGGLGVGGFYHLSTPFKPTPMTVPSPSINGEMPNLNDPLYETLIYRSRQWALYKNTSLPGCMGGFSDYDPAKKSYATGATCFRNQIPTLISNPSKALTLVNLFVPTFVFLEDTPVAVVPVKGYSGDLVVNYTANSGSYPTNIITDSQFPTYIKNSKGTIASGKSQITVPAPIARMGIYLHLLQDRISHAKCGDASYATVNSSNQIDVQYDMSLCTQDLHAYGHYQEVGFNPLQTRTFSALTYTYDELTQWLSLNPSYKGTGKTVSKGVLIGTSASPGTLTNLLIEANGCKRLKNIADYTKSVGYTPMPGLSDTSKMCP